MIFPKVRFFNLKKIFLVLVLISLFFASGYLVGRKGFKLETNSSTKVIITRDVHQGVDFKLFWRVWDIVTSEYLEKSKINNYDLVYGAIKGMVAAIGDPYTVFLAPKDNKIIQEDLKGSFDGVGIQIGFKGKSLVVIAPLPGTPAERAGIKAGDVILGIKDELRKIDRSTVGISLDEAVSAIRGPKGSKVTLALLRDGADEASLVEVVREEIDVQSVSLTFLAGEKKIAHLKLLKFGAETKKEWDKAVMAILKEDTSGIILDLRNNPGGYLQGSVDTAGDFLKTGTLVVSQESADGEKEDFKATFVPRLTQFPLVVLVNEGSASASEILAAALRDQLGVKIIGNITFGKGTIQEPKSLENGSGLHITVGKWLTPNGIWLEEKGLDPDVKIEDNSETTEDEQLEKAQEILLQIAG